MDQIKYFQESHPSTESYWRSIILFGSNSASYKFALAKSLIDLSKEGKTEVAIDEIAVPFSKYICEHLKEHPRQCVNQSSTFLNTCKTYLDDGLSYDEFIKQTVKYGFVNVLDAFHIVNGNEIPIRFFNVDSSFSKKRILLTDSLKYLSDKPFTADLVTETESRWNLVETAWEINVSSSLLDVKYDDVQKLFFEESSFRRKGITSARGALNGYQKGKCFYCFDEISIISGLDHSCEVDHFFPHVLQQFMPDVNLDGVWNLVLSCESCNRGESGKMARVPAVKYLERLYRRNEFLISSHHPLRETIIKQTGSTSSLRRQFLQKMDQRAIDILAQRWDTQAVGKETF